MIKLSGAVVAAILGLSVSAYADDPPANPPPSAPNENLNNGGAERPWAKGVSKTDQDTALALFRDGNVFLNQGLFEKAAEKYHEALKHWDHPAINYNLALALRSLNQPLEIDSALHKALQYGPEPLDNDKYELAKQYLQINSQLLAEIEVSCDKQGADVSIDGIHAFTGPGKVAKTVKIGKHTIVAQKPGAISRIRAPNIGPQEHFRVELKLYTPEELTRYKRKWENTWFPFAIAGAGAAVAIVGGVFELSARSSFDEFDKDVATCNTNHQSAGCPTNAEGLQAIKDRGNTKQAFAYAGYGIGAAAIIVGAGLAYVNRRESYQIRAEDMQDEQDKEPTGVSIAPVVTPNLAGAVLQGHF
jgi:hypothetical protein|nr:hypothetical protein [Kofleriaceae bacterium]